jgi:hypothetical protein
MKLARFSADVYNAGIKVFVQGQHYVITDETKHQIALGNAEEVDIKVDLERAQKLAAKAQEAVAKAEESARAAKADADACAEAQRLLDQANADILAGREASADEIQLKTVRAAELRAHADSLIAQASEAGRELEAAEARAKSAPDDEQLHELALAAQSNAASLSEQATQADADANTAAEELAD